MNAATFPRLLARPVDGVLLLDKPLGISSNAALQRVKRLFNAEKAGHTGTLDPLATGLLPICFGEATKFAAFALESRKRYSTRVKLGVTTTTGDAEGAIVAHRVVDVGEPEVLALLPRFTGDQDQTPHQYSAVKQKGKPSYRYARQGIKIEQRPRRIVIDQLELTAFHGDEIELLVDCSSGTYIRSLAEDLGTALECGAHLRALRRLGCGGFDLQQAVTFDELQAMDEPARGRRLLPVEELIAHLPRLSLDAAQATALACGQTINLPALANPGSALALYQADSADGGFEAAKFLGVGSISESGTVKARRLMRTDGLVAGRHSGLVERPAL